MSSDTNNALTKEQLFACLEQCLTLEGEIDVDAATINKAKYSDGGALRDIGYAYSAKKQDYSKAMAWYRLALNQNYSQAYNNIGFLYRQGLGVSRDYLTAMECFLKTARGNNDSAMLIIAHHFLNRRGVPLDKYKALEWFIKSGKKPREVEKLNEEGIHLRQEDKNKSIYQLANETDDIIREVRMETESRLKEEVKELKTRESKSNKENDELKTRVSTLKEELKSSNEKDIQKLQNELQQQKALLDNLEQQLTDKAEIIRLLKRESNVYQALVQSKNNEINLLKKDNQRYENMEKKNIELKHKLERYSQGPLVDNSDNNATTSTIAELDSQRPLNDTPTSSLDNIRVKVEPEPECGNSLSCQIANKKRKMSPNDS